MRFEQLVQSAPEDLSRLIDQIGNTPMHPINLIIDRRVCRVHLKLEGANPTGSMKDRTGRALMQHFDMSGSLNKGTVIVESTSGNLGVTLAFLCKAREYHFIAVVDPKTTEENITKMQALGAQIEMIYDTDRTGGYLLSRLARVQELCHSFKNYIWTNQYSNPANPRAHYMHTGPEIYAQMDEKVDVIFVPVSTGGTLAGIGQFFREVSPLTRIIGVDAYGSVIFGTPAAPRKLTGIGSSQLSSFIHKQLYDAHMLVKDEDAFAFCRALFAAKGLMVGGSSGAVLYACAQYLSTYRQDLRVACLCADRGENYISSIFNDDWIRQQEPHLSYERIEKAQVALCQLIDRN